MTKKRDELYKLAIVLLGNEGGSEFMNEIDMLCSDDEYIGIYTKLSKKELEYNTYIAEAKEEGFNSGFNDGEKSAIEKVAQNMLKQNININIISIVTGLTKNEIEILKKAII